MQDNLKGYCYIRNHSGISVSIWESKYSQASTIWIIWLAVTHKRFDCVIGCQYYSNRVALIKNDHPFINIYTFLRIIYLFYLMTGQAFRFKRISYDKSWCLISWNRWKILSVHPTNGNFAWCQILTDNILPGIRFWLIIYCTKDIYR